VKKLTLTDWAQLAEIIAAVAVVISLIYVGAGLRANTAAIRSASVQAITNTSVALLTAQTTSADLSRIRRIGDLDQLPKRVSANETRCRGGRPLGDLPEDYLCRVSETRRARHLEGSRQCAQSGLC
jgi:hypothetical protein